MDEWTRDAIVHLSKQVQTVSVRTGLLLIVCGLSLGLLIGLTFGVLG